LARAGQRKSPAALEERTGQTFGRRVMSSTSKPAGQLTFGSIEELDAWLATVTGTAEELARVVYLALRTLRTPKGAGGAFDHKMESFKRLRNRFRDDEDGLWDALEAAEAEWANAKLKADEAKREADEERAEERRRRSFEAQKALRRWQREEEDLRIEREIRADQVKEIAEHFGCTIRYAQMILRNGVKDPKRAKELADLCETSIGKFLKRKAKPGRDPDLVGRMMKMRPHGTSLRDYAEDDIELEGPALEALESLQDVLADCHTFEQLAAFANEREVDPDAVALAWLNFKKWHIEAVAERAAQEVQDEIERRYPFG